MQAEIWKDIREIWRAAQKIEPPHRAAFLDASAPNEEIRREVESLLECEVESEDFMTLPVAAFSEDFLPPDADSAETPLAGRRVGNYEIVREIGGGGMGAVYLGKRADGKFEQMAAIKMLRREFNTAKIRRNFEREKEILARLEHPHIARLLDAGTTDDAVPFLVMEYVEGVPVDRFCDQKNLSLIERLKLFNQICEAVSFAHRNLIVHRDLKPTNILVNEKGEPKLLDFGISKLLGAEPDEERTSVTLPGAMTPEYASPEQIRGENISTATDVYSLGVVLYKILTGALPYNLKGKTNGDLLKQITEIEPPAPSAIWNLRFRISDFKTARADSKPIDKMGQKENPKSQMPNPKSLRGDLDNIILKALAKEPERRYESVREFAADLWRYIDGLPVAARPATFRYRFDKFFGRNKITVIAGVIVFLSLIGGLFAVARGKIHADRQAAIAREQTDIAVESRRVAESETSKARSEQEKAEKITRFMSKIIGYANPAWYAEGAKFGADARVIDAIEDLSDKIDREFAAEPDVAAELHHKFSEVYLMSGRGKTGAELEKFTEKRKFHALRALELRRKFYGERHELVAKDLFYAHWFLGETDEQQARVLLDAINMMRETNPHNLNFPYMLLDYAGDLIMLDVESHHAAYRRAANVENGYELAEQMLREALTVFRLHYKEDNQAIYSAECRLAYVLAIEEKWTDFSEHFNVCTRDEAKMPDYIKKEIELVKTTLAKKNARR